MFDHLGSFAEGRFCLNFVHLSMRMQKSKGYFSTGALGQVDKLKPCGKMVSGAARSSVGKARRLAGGLGKRWIDISRDGEYTP
jgi:hypothetical protein